MSRRAPTHVQTELAPSEYEAFREFATERGLTVKEAVHEAVTDWIDRQRRADPADRAFTVLEELDVESSAETDARQEADLVTEWSGDEVAFRLAEDPLTER